MRLPSLFNSSRGRMAAFFLLYMTEGIPLGFAATAVATQLRRQGVGPAEIGAFVGSFYLPWAFKWAAGPFVDSIYSRRLGRRRGWILVMQVLMAATLLSTMALSLPQQLGLFTIILLVHNSFAAMQDVAIDALAVNTLAENERATANGFMFAGANIGQMVGGAGSLFLAGYLGFQSTFVFVAASILAVTVFVVLPLKEPASLVPEAPPQDSAIRTALRDMRQFALTAFRSFVGTRGAFAALFMAMLPPGAMCLGLALQSNLAVELGMNDDQVAWLSLGSSVLGALGCVVGGRIADRIDRRKALNVYIGLMTLPVLAMAAVLWQYHWIMPVAEGAKRPDVAPLLLAAFWVATMFYGFAQGLMYSAANANLMDVTNPVVAATQFTAYMALANLAISYSATWQGIAIEAWGYPGTMVLDALLGLAYLLVLPLTRRRQADPPGFNDTRGADRARAFARALALLCLAWLPVYAVQDSLGSAQPIAHTLFSLVFIASALFLLAGGMVLGDTAASPIATWAKRFAPLLLLMLARTHLEGLAHLLSPLVTLQQLQSIGPWLFCSLPVLAAVLLWQMAGQPWRGLHQQTAEPQAEGTAA